MSLAIIGFMLVSGFYFIYEGIILPSMRLSMRYKLFAIRDRLRDLKAEKPDELKDDAFKYLHDGINNTIRILPILSLSIFFEIIKEYRKNRAIGEKAERKAHVLDTCDLPEVRTITGELVDCTFKTIFINSAGWAIWIAPFAIVAYVITLMVGAIKRCQVMIRAILRVVIFLPEKTNHYVEAHNPELQY
jgi:hypothetical protein